MPILKKVKPEPQLRINRDNRRQIYNSQRWKKLRRVKLIQNPLCEICLKDGKIVPAVDIHHKDSFTNYTGQLRYYKAYDFDNLLSVCKQCHAALHKNGTTHG